MELKQISIQEVIRRGKSTLIIELEIQCQS